MHSPAELFDLAYKKEHAAARKLARTAGLSGEAALQQILEIAAGNQSLAELLATRRQLRLQETERISVRRQAQQEALARKNKPTAPADAWLAWFDGSSHPNPGRMGIGGLLQSPEGRTVEISRHVGHGDSSEAEYLALNAVLDAAVTAQPARLVIHGDSQVVIDDIRGTRRPALSLTEQRERALRSIAQLAHVTFVWIPRHKNTRADELSQYAVRVMSGCTTADV